MSPFSSFCGKVFSFHIDIMGGFAGNGVLLMTHEAERMGLALVCVCVSGWEGC